MFNRHMFVFFLKKITYILELIRKILSYKLKLFKEYDTYIYIYTHITIGKFGIQFIVRDIL